MKKTFRPIIKTILPEALQKMLRYYRKGNPKHKKILEEQIPKIPLAKKHIRNCKLLLKRSSLLSHLKKEGIVCEIGVDRGNFSEKILKITQPTILHLVDVWDSERYHDGLLQMVNSKFSQEIKNGKIKIHQNYSTNAAKHFNDNYFDWIYIDTDHSYKTTWKELTKYAPKIKENGVIAGHDYSMGNWIKSYRYGVIEAVHKFCVEYDWELIYLTIEPIERQSFAIRRIQE